MSKDRECINMEELKDVSGGNINLGKVMGEVAKDRAEGKDTTFAGALIEEIIEEFKEKLQ